MLVAPRSVLLFGTELLHFYVLLVHHDLQAFDLFKVVILLLLTPALKLGQALFQVLRV